MPSLTEYVYDVPAEGTDTKEISYALSAEIQLEIHKFTVKNLKAIHSAIWNPNGNPEIQTEIQKSKKKYGISTSNPEVKHEILKPNGDPINRSRPYTQKFWD